MTRPPAHRLVIVVRADPVICGHSGEARNLAEAALDRGFDDVRILSWPIERLQETGLLLKPLDRVLLYSPGIVVERPEPVVDHKAPDGCYLAGFTSRLVELFTDGVPTVCMSLYLSPHAVAVADAVRVAHSTGPPVNVVTVAEAVGSDVTNVVRPCLEENRWGAVALMLSSYLAHDVCLAVSDFTRDLILAEAAELDAAPRSPSGARVGLPWPTRRSTSGPSCSWTRARAGATGCSRDGARIATATCSSGHGWTRPRGSTT